MSGPDLMLLKEAQRKIDRAIPNCVPSSGADCSIVFALVRMHPLLTKKELEFRPVPQLTERQESSSRLHPKKTGVLDHGDAWWNLLRAQLFA